MLLLYFERTSFREIVGGWLMLIADVKVTSIISNFIILKKNPFLDKIWFFIWKKLYTFQWISEFSFVSQCARRLQICLHKLLCIWRWGGSKKREECNNGASKFVFLISRGSKHAHYLLQTSYWNCEAESANFWWSICLNISAVQETNEKKTSMQVATLLKEMEEEGVEYRNKAGTINCDATPINVDVFVKCVAMTKQISKIILT